MKTIFIVIAIFVMVNWHTEARGQEKKLNNQEKELVCKPTADKKGTKCYTSKYAQNFKVCKGNKSYYICGKMPGTGVNSSTLPPTIVVASAGHHASKQKVSVSGQSQSYVITNKSDVYSANAVGGHRPDQVCKPGSVSGTEHCYTSKFNQNFPVCRGDKGYYICQKIPTQQRVPYDYPQFSNYDDNSNVNQTSSDGSTGIKKGDGQVAPQNQSYKNIKH